MQDFDIYTRFYIKTYSNNCGNIISKMSCGFLKGSADGLRAPRRLGGKYFRCPTALLPPARTSCGSGDGDGRDIGIGVSTAWRRGTACQRNPLRLFPLPPYKNGKGNTRLCTTYNIAHALS